ncbi:hypothetical protein ACUXCC_004538 [Cytobacillus horneckiae]
MAEVIPGEAGKSTKVSLSKRQKNAVNAIA